jgi:beta-galactosidase
MAKASALEGDPFLHRHYDSLNASVFQNKLRRIRPMPFGVVFLPYPGVTEMEIRGHFRTIRSLGFNSIKQFMSNPDWTIARLREICLEEGLIPWTYGEAGWEDPTPELLERLGLPADLTMQEVRSNPIFLAHQGTVLANRIRRESKSKDEDLCRVDERKLARSCQVQNPTRLEDTYHQNGPGIPEEHRPLFFDWLRSRYQTITALNEAWNLEHVGIGPTLFADWDDLASRYPEVSSTEYRHILDQLRFKADMAIARVREDRDTQRKLDPHAPCRIGGEVGMFLPHAWWGIDFEGLAELMADSGSFYPSIHLAWHFEETDFEFVRPIYMQASYAADLFKGGWSATWESTGGPQQFSGGKGPAHDLLERISAFTVHGGTMTQLLLSYVAAGLRGVGLWTWNARSAGWEAGEYALLDRNHQVTNRAVRAGLIGRAANRYRDELWEAHEEPMVGVFQDWDNDAMWAAISVSNRDQFRHWPRPSPNWGLSQPHRPQHSVRIRHGL